MLNITKSDALAYHSGGRPGRIEITPTKPCRTQRDLSMANPRRGTTVSIELGDNSNELPRNQ